MSDHATTIFGAMSARAATYQAINLGQGFPDTDGPDELKDIARQAITDGLGNQYPPAHGLPDLRLAIVEHQLRFYDLTLDPDTDVVVTTGASEALASALLALLEPDDEVVLFEPWFDIYGAGISLARARRVSVPMTADLRPDLDRLQQVMSARTKVLLINSPHNPTGTVFTGPELQRIADIAIEHDLVVIADEAYEHLWFDGHPHIPISTLPGMFDRTITVGSGGKSFSFTGWKVGWASGPADLIAAVRVVRQHLSYVSGGPFQYAFARGLRLPDSYFTQLRLSLQAKRDLLAAGLSELGLTVLPSQGTYYLTTDIAPLGFHDGVQFCWDLPMVAGVAAIPHQVFYDTDGAGVHHVRWAFCKKDQVLQQALDRLGGWLGHRDADGTVSRDGGTVVTDGAVYRHASTHQQASSDQRASR